MPGLISRRLCQGLFKKINNLIGKGAALLNGPFNKFFVDMYWNFKVVAFNRLFIFMLGHIPRILNVIYRVNTITALTKIRASGMLLLHLNCI